MMESSIVDSILSRVPAQVTSSLAERLGGSEYAVSSGLGTSIAATLGGLANRAGDQGFMSQIFNLINGFTTQSALITSLVSGAEGLQVTEQGSRLASLLFGIQQSKIEQLIGRESGMGATAGGRLLSLGVPLTAGYLAQQIRDRGLSASSFASLVSLEGSKIQAMLPAGFATLLSGFTVPLMARKVTVNVGSEREGRKLSLVLIALVAIGLVAWLVSRGCNKSQSVAVAPAETESSPAPVPAPLGAFITHKLPDGTELNIPSLGIENKLIDFIEDSSKPVDKTTWFDFDRLTFDTGKATLQDSSAEQLRNISAILKAYPKLTVKIGGYTDNTGAKQANLKLSQDRASNVMGEFVKRGTEPSRLEAEGYGEDHPVADNATEEGRAKNRRISLRVTGK